MTATTAAPAVTTATVTASGQHGAYRVLWMHAPSIAAGVRPGEFVNVMVEPGFLRRPFSVYRVDRVEGTVAIAFDAIGPGTEWLGARASDDALDVVGPLGHGFDVPDDPGCALLVGGGYGTAALVFLAEQLADRGGQVHAVLGGRSAERVFTDDTLNEVSASVAIVTDDGSMGKRGIVTDPIPSLVARFRPRAIYACGPNPMLAALGHLGGTLGVPTHLAVEEFMACGLGVCWTCVVPITVDGQVKHHRCCTEGPVFDGGSLAWA